MLLGARCWQLPVHELAQSRELEIAQMPPFLTEETEAQSMMGTQLGSNGIGIGTQECRGESIRHPFENS